MNDSYFNELTTGAEMINNITIDNAHTHKEALEIKKEYEKTDIKGENNEEKLFRI